MKAKLDNINLWAKSPKQLRDFYVNVLGLQELDYIPHPSAMYIIDCKGCTLSISDASKSRKEVLAEAIELGFEVEDVSALYEKIKHSTGKIVSEKEEKQWGKSFIASDPEGHLINIYRFVNVVSS